MKFLVQILLTITLCAVLQYFLPWWTLAIGTFVVAFLFDQKGFPSFAAGFIGVGILWLGTRDLYQYGDRFYSHRQA